MKNILRILLVNVLYLVSCSSEMPMTKEVSPPNNDVEVIWRHPLSDPFVESYSMSPVLSREEVWFSTIAQFDSLSAPLLIFDKESGEVLKTLEYSVGSVGFTDWEEQWYDDEQIVFNSGNSLYNVDLIDKKVEWSHYFGSMVNRGLLYEINHELYTTHEFNGFTPNLSGGIIKTSLDLPSWQTVFNYTNDDNYSVNLSCLTPAVKANGDELIVFKNRQWNFELSKGRLCLLAYNLTKQKLEWRAKGIEAWDGGIVPLRIENGVIYCLGGRLAFAFDLETGAKLWEFDYGSRSPGNHFGYGDLILVNNGTVVIKPSGGELFALSKETGELIWWKENMGWTMDGRFTVFRKKLYYIADADLIIADMYTGERLLSEDRQDHLGKLTGDVRIDPQTRYMYMANYHEALCVKIPSDAL